MEMEPAAALLKLTTKAKEVEELPVVVMVTRSVKNPLHPSSDCNVKAEVIARTLVNLRGSITPRILHEQRTSRGWSNGDAPEPRYTEFMDKRSTRERIGLRFNTFAASCAVIAMALACAAQTALPAKTQLAQVSERDVRAEMNFLASDAMQGRGSGTQFELIAGTYIASMLQEFGIEPAGDAGADAKPGY